MVEQPQQSENTPSPTPSRAIYGFVLYVASYVLYGAYIMWALLPDSWLNALGITYLPARHWVITFPMLMYVFIFLVVVVYGSSYVINSRDMWNETMVKDSEVPSCREDLTDLDAPVDVIPSQLSIGRHSLRERKPTQIT